MSRSTQNASWPGWETTRIIGRGSFGDVYEIQRNMFGEIERAALKVISVPQDRNDLTVMCDDGYDQKTINLVLESNLKSIIAEYSLMRKMNGSTNIVNCDDVHYVRHEDGIGWDILIKMELLTPLTKALPDQISEDMVIKIAKDLCAALELCKKHDIVHRDIKPQNIFVSANGDFKLGDFGIAKTVEKTMGGTKIGTFRYMAPEVYNNQPYGSSADIYSLGLVLYWLLNERRTPFLPTDTGIVTASMEEEARRRRFSGEQLPPPAQGSEALKRIVLKACAYDPKNRYASASEMLMDLQNIGLHEKKQKQTNKQRKTGNKKKKLPFILAGFAAVIALLLIIGLWFSSRTVASGQCGTDVTWLLSSNGILTIEGTGVMDDFQSNSDTPWCSFRDDIKQVVIHDGVTTIGKYAFSHCSNLTDIALPGSLTEIGMYTFSNCIKLANVDIPDCVISIGMYTFNNCMSLTSVDLPDSIDVIGEGVFRDCISLKNIDIPSSVIHIRAHAFANCTALTDITIPDSVTAIGTYAFSNCAAMTVVSISGNVSAIGEGVFRDCVALINVTIPDSVKEIRAYAFDNCVKLTKITIPVSVTKIDAHAFDDCVGLKSITIPDSVIVIGEGAFDACTGLTRITIQNPSCAIFDAPGTLGLSDTTVIYGQAGSTAAEYAQQHSYAFSEIH